MKEFWRIWKADVLVSAVLCIIAGMVIMIWPATLVMIVGRVVGVVVLVLGISAIVKYIQNRAGSPIGLASGVIVSVLGLWIFTRPEVIAQMIAIVIGVLLIMHGIQGIMMAAEAKAIGDTRWLTSMILAVLTVILGLVVIYCYFRLASIATWVIGLVLVYDGVTELLVAGHVIGATRKYRKKDDVIDAEWRDAE